MSMEEWVGGGWLEVCCMQCLCASFCYMCDVSYYTLQSNGITGINVMLGILKYWSSLMEF
jgi:hypothetical protein